MALMTPESTDDSQANSAELSSLQLGAWKQQFAQHPTAQLMQNAVTQNGVDNVALNRQIVTSTDHSFSHVLDDWGVTNQKRSGRCWMFAGLNVFRPAAMKAMNLKNFEFSQNFTLFWDKLERANFFLEAIIDTADRDVDDRTVAWLLEHPLDDGGQWNMFVNVVKKHGLVPKAAMPESHCSSNTRRMNSILVTKLREGALQLRNIGNGSDEKTAEQMREAQQDLMETIYRILSIHLGTPPDQFNWQWNDKDKDFTRDGEMTPQEFADKYGSSTLDDFICLVHDPRPSSPTGKTFTVDYLGNVVGGDIVRYLNIDIETMKEIAMKTILDGEPVWMGCDVGKMMRRDLGIWDAQLFDYEGIYDTPFNMSKSERLFYHQTVMTHAMLFTGVDVIDTADGPKPRRWRVENSWGDENGRKGFYLMNDSWFDEYMFEIATHKKYVPQELVEAWEQEPIHLPPWDPMGALAR